VTLFGYASAPRGSVALGPAWSLDIELQFYVVAPFIVRFLKRSATLAPILLAAIGTVGVLFYLWGHSNWLLDYFGFFFLGTLCAHYNWRPSKMWAAGSGLLWVSAILVLPLIPVTRTMLIGGKAPGAEFLRYNEFANVLSC
jgi:peptidoglycan/LPS O-acetylase OafA/YrhL